MCYQVTKEEALGLKLLYPSATSFNFKFKQRRNEVFFIVNFLNHKGMILKTITEETLGMRLRHQMYLLNCQQIKLLHFTTIFSYFLVFWITERRHGN